MATSKIGKIMVGVSAVIFVLLMVAVALITIESRKKVNTLLSEGIRVQATVLSMDKTGTRKNKGYTMVVSMFVMGPAESVVKDTILKTEAERLVDSIFDNAISKIGVNDSYQSLNINVTSSTYYNHKVGDKVDVVYLKENPKEVMLLEEIDGK